MIFLISPGGICDPSLEGILLIYIHSLIRTPEQTNIIGCWIIGFPCWEAWRRGVCKVGGPLLAINWSYNLCKCSMNGLLWLSHPYINWVCFTLLITGRGDLVSVFLYPWMIFREWSLQSSEPDGEASQGFLLVPFSSVEHDRYIYLCTWMYDLYS